MALLSPHEIEQRLATVPGWQHAGDAIRRTYEFASFQDSMDFANRVAALAEAMDHHPDILIQYQRVTLTLSSHDAGGLTTRDFRLAARIDA